MSSVKFLFFLNGYSYSSVSFCFFYVVIFYLFFFFFFFQAEDGIRDDLVTGVQTCALPIYRGSRASASGPTRRTLPRRRTARGPRTWARPRPRRGSPRPRACPGGRP